MELERFVNETEAQVPAFSCVPCGDSAAAWQPRALRKHRRGHMFLPRVSLALLTAALPWSAIAQNAAPADPPIQVTDNLRPALAQVGQALSGINVKRWKAPNEVRSNADQDVSSIQRDLNGTLAGLMQQADAAPGSIPAAFAVYRNVNALYDTLLRVVLTANLAAPDTEVNALQGALSSLESARSTVGDSILNASQKQQADMVNIRTALAKASQVQRAPVTTTVVDDGPTPAAKPKHNAKKPSSTTKPASTPSNPQ